MDACPCASGEAFARCCGAFIEAGQFAPSAQALMRSRYSAFARHYPQYLLDTLHASKREGETLQALRDSCAQTDWCGLRILDTRRGLPGDADGEVEFVAFYRLADDIAQLHERSRFCFEEGRWYYLDGEMLPPLKLGRNDPCWCGSGRKLKKCHPA